MTSPAKSDWLPWVIVVLLWCVWGVLLALVWP